MITTLRSTNSPARSLQKWLLDHGLRIWSDSGVDQENGGFFEKLTDQYKPIEEPRRARLVARQIYVFSAGKELGWQGPSQALVAHGLDFLFNHLVRSDGRVIASCTPQGVTVDRRQYLYDVAFVLFALAHVARTFPTLATQFDLNYDPTEIAERIFNNLVTQHSHPLGGFVEETEPEVQCANPHMHLLEAFLAWAESTDLNGQTWQKAAKNIATTALDQMIDPTLMALPEFFDNRWQAIAREGSIIVEPGHQFEWSWLLARWAHLTNDRDINVAASKLAETGETYGVNRELSIAFHRLDGELNPLDRRAKLWAQTERAKAWHVQALVSENPEYRTQAERLSKDALCSVMAYLDSPNTGLWYEERENDGEFSKAHPTKASSLYHLVCAIETVNKSTLNRGSGS